jgi:dynein heavy chain
VNTKDLAKLEENLMSNVLTLFNFTQSQVFISERLVFGDFFDGNQEETRPYKIIPDLKGMVIRIEEYLEDYNSGSKNPMRLVMFLDACDHVARICRILR